MSIFQISKSPTCKAINDGEKSIVVGMAMLGLTEDLDIDNEDRHSGSCGDKGRYGQFLP